MNKWPDDVVNRFKCWWDNRETRCGETHVNCRDCPFHVPGYSMQDAVKDAIGWFYRLEAAQPKWISVENPPEEDGEYIVAAVTPDGRIIKTWDAFKTGLGWCSDGNVFENVLYYMAYESLPEPPKEEA